MQLPRRSLLTGAATLAASPGWAQAALPAFRIGVLTDLSGQYRDNSGPTSVLAAHQAVEDFRPEQHGFSVSIVSADHGQKPDLASRHCPAMVRRAAGGRDCRPQQHGDRASRSAAWPKRRTARC